MTNMDMTSAQSGSDLERYGDEVLNASWLPQYVLEQGQQAHEPAHPNHAGISDPDAFMRQLYRAQE